jgi:hypothetical protein
MHFARGLEPGERNDDITFLGARIQSINRADEYKWDDEVAPASILWHGLAPTETANGKPVLRCGFPLIWNHQMT